MVHGRRFPVAAIVLAPEFIPAQNSPGAPAYGQFHLTYGLGPWENDGLKGRSGHLHQPEASPGSEVEGVGAPCRQGPERFAPTQFDHGQVVPVQGDHGLMSVLPHFDLLSCGVGAPWQTRTATDRLLRPGPLPIGVRGHWSLAREFNPAIRATRADPQACGKARLANAIDALGGAPGQTRTA